ncbi:MAG: TonB-dependent receptor, partial [Dysgonamonadaceae bacterium]|nr:TonB-dependent receptor [Dysgonamonadaceae bacterium]
MKLIVLLSAGICTLPLQAQKTVGKDSLLNREMTLEKRYSPTIEPATKIIRLPELHEPQAPESKVAFSNYFPACETQSELVSLLPKAMLTDWNVSQYAGFISLRLSTVLNFDADAACRILNTGRDFLDIYFSRRSSNSKNPSLQISSESQKFFMNDNWGGFNFSHDFDRAKLSAGFKYTYSAFN